MHLLRRESDGEFSLTEYHGQPPPYAILSHTWGSDSDEVTFKDIEKGRGKNKTGYEKLRFCARQAREDGLEYFWVDTCCIDKKDSVKLSEAINSMFSWYQQSSRCYVYLTDVRRQRNGAAAVVGLLTRNKPSSPRKDSGRHWEISFRASKWFTRGWTLQELLAPTSVKFFNQEGDLLDDRQGLARIIHEITGISVQALHKSGLSLSNFSIDERMSWAKGRSTKRPEDAAYSLLGLCGVHMPPIYGEGQENAFFRLRWEIERKAAISQKKGVMATDESLPNISPSLSASQKSVETTGIGAQWHDAEDWYPHQLHRDNVTKDNERKMKLWWDNAIAANLDTTDAWIDDYEKAAALLVKWADEPEDSKRSQEVNELDHVLRVQYGFHTEMVVLDVSHQAEHQMNRSLDRFTEQNDGPNNLLVILYWR